MRLLIITLSDSVPNYGNRLQNYAVQEILKKYTDNVQTVVYDSVSRKQKIIHEVKYFVHRITGYRFSKSSFKWRYKEAQRRKFQEFSNKYISELKVTRLDGLSDKADFFVLGSDQVWNPFWFTSSGYKKDLYLLTFCEDKKKVCLSPSFGVSSLPIEWRPWFKKYLDRIPALSVREEKGAEIIENLIGKKAEVLIDPTLMLTKQEWLKIAEAPKFTEKLGKYVLTYFLGGCSDEVEMNLSNLRKQGFQIINLFSEANPEYYTLGPSEFIYLVSKANLILTDSFHACVFSFIFEKPFLIYPRGGNEQNMASRIDTLLKKFHLERKYAYSELKNEIFEADYVYGTSVLEEERKKVHNFLDRAITNGNI